MKRHEKLTLRTETVRALGVKDLVTVVGASDTQFSCDSNCSQICSGRHPLYCPGTGDSCLCVPP